MKMTQVQLDQAWDGRVNTNSTVAWFKDGKGHDSDFMTIGFDGHDQQTYERSVKSTEWREVTTAPVQAQQSPS